MSYSLFYRCGSDPICGHYELRYVVPRWHFCWLCQRGAGLLKVDIETRLILNDRVLAFPCGQCTPEALLQAAFELGKRSAPLRVDENPFLHRKRRSLVRPEPNRGAQAVAWLRGHYLTREALATSEPIDIREAIDARDSADACEDIEFQQAA